MTTDKIMPGLEPLGRLLLELHCRVPRMYAACFPWPANGAPWLNEVPWLNHFSLVDDGLGPGDFGTIGTCGPLSADDAPWWCEPDAILALGPYTRPTHSVIWTNRTYAWFGSDDHGAQIGLTPPQAADQIITVLSLPHQADIDPSAVTGRVDQAEFERAMAMLCHTYDECADAPGVVSASAMGVLTHHGLYPAARRLTAKICHLANHLLETSCEEHVNALMDTFFDLAFPDRGSEICQLTHEQLGPGPQPIIPLHLHLEFLMKLLNLKSLLSARLQELPPDVA